MKNIARTFWGGVALAASSIVSNAYAKGDDVDFARALVRNGFVEMATEYCDRLSKDPKTTAEDKAGLQLIQAEIFAKTATLKDTPEEKQAEMDKAIDVLRNFIKNSSGHPRVSEAKFTIGTLLRQKGEALGEAMKKTTGADEKEKIRVEGDKYFKEAEDYFTVLIEEFRNQKDELESKLGGGGTPEQLLEVENMTYNLMDSMYNVPRTQYAHCMLYDSGANRKTELAKKAIDGFMNFELDYGDRMKAFESAIFWALTHKELGEFDKVHERFDYAISLKTMIEGELPPEARDIILTAFYFKAQSYNEERKYAEAMKTVDSMVGMLKEAAYKERMGIAALLLKGEAMMGLGDSDGAEKLGQDLYKKAPTPGLQAMIRAKMAGWAKPGSGNIQGYLIRYEAALDRNDDYAAIRALQGAVAAAEAAEQTEPVPDLLKKMAEVYEKLERWYDVVICYEQIAKDAVEVKKAGGKPYADADKCAYLAATTWQKIATRIGGEKSWEKEQVNVSLQLLVKNWPDSSFSKNTQYLVADAAFEKGNYEEAAKQYLKVPEDAVYYERAMVMAGKAYFEIARQEWNAGKKDDSVKKKFDNAQAAFEKYLAYTKTHEPKDKLKAERTGVQAYCKQTLANLLMHEAKKQYSDAIKVLDEIDGPDAIGDVQKRVWRQKVTAYLESGQVDKAIEYTDKLMSNFKNAKETIESCQLVGTRCDEEATKLAGENPKAGAVPENALAFWEKAAKYYANWIQGTVDAKMRFDPKDALQVADRIYGLGVLINDIDPAKSFTTYDLSTLKNARIFHDAARIYEPIANERSRTIDTSKLLLKMAWCYDFSQDWDRARDSYEQLFDAERLRKGKLLDDTVVQAKKHLFGAYEELGHVYLRLAAAGNNRAGSLEEAMVIFSNVVNKAEKDSKGWWQAKYHVIKILFEKGGPGDFEFALLGIKDMRSNYPQWDNDKFGQKNDWDALEKMIFEKAPKK